MSTTMVELRVSETDVLAIGTRVRLSVDLGAGSPIPFKGEFDRLRAFRGFDGEIVGVDRGSMIPPYPFYRVKVLSPYHRDGWTLLPFLTADEFTVLEP